MTPEQTLKFIAKRLPSREVLEDLRAAVMLSDDFEAGTGLDKVIDNLFDVRQAVKGGQRNIRSKHWNQHPEKGDWSE